ncbi:MAG: hypothetical protein JXB88_07235 [Spirochaetales bacterium]|nr:hypothetical protein [Spirochaetales bacterium]
MSLFDFIIPIGIITISCLVITVILGLRTNLFPAKIRVKLHITIAIITLVLALIHAGIVIYSKIY